MQTHATHREANRAGGEDFGRGEPTDDDARLDVVVTLYVHPNRVPNRETDGP